jgi:microcystin-dependent protein
MNARTNKTAAAIAMAAALLGWSGASLACPSEPYMSTVCVMANQFAPYGFMQAAGQTLPVAQYDTLFALLGNTYGGDGVANFRLPDLRGRFLLGAGQQPNSAAHVLGSTGGSETVTLTQTNLPPMASSSVTTTVNLPTAPVSVDLSKVTGITATLSSMSFTANANGLNLMGTDTAGAVTTANGNALGTANTPNVKLYVNAAPNVAMAPGSISGTINGTIAAATAPVNFQGKLSVPVPAQTASVGTSVSFLNPNQQAISIMPPYVALNYYIAVQGVYPTRAD